MDCPVLLQLTATETMNYDDAFTLEEVQIQIAPYILSSLFFILSFSLDPWPLHTHCMLKVKEPLLDNFNTVAGFVPILKTYIREVGAQHTHTCMCTQAYTRTPTHTHKHTPPHTHKHTDTH